jgi:hypothetical protein
VLSPPLMITVFAVTESAYVFVIPPMPIAAIALSIIANVIDLFDDIIRDKRRFL